MSKTAKSLKPETKTVPIGNVSTHPGNVRRGNVHVIQESLAVHGQYRPIVVQRSTNRIIAGNHTYLAAKALGWDEIDATFIEVNDDDAIRIMLVDNRTTELATNDEAALLELLQSLNEEISGTGYDSDDVEDLIFKVEGNLGTMTDALSASERFSEYEARGVKSIVLPFDNSEYEELQPMLIDLRKRWDLETNSQLFAALVREAHND